MEVTSALREETSAPVESSIEIREEVAMAARARADGDASTAKRMRVTEGQPDGPSNVSIPPVAESGPIKTESPIEAVRGESEKISAEEGITAAPLETTECQSEASSPAAPGNEGVEVSQRKQKKRKIALFIAYNGDKYHGMQRNPGVHTIEGELEQALYKAGGIGDGNYGDPRKIYWMRAARTDKGVSALGQVVSARIVIEPPGFVERVNSFLPIQIRILGFKRVVNSFCAKQMCDRRSYEYIMPTFAFDPDSNKDRAWLVRRTNGGSEADRAEGGGPTSAMVEDDSQVLPGQDNCQVEPEVAVRPIRVDADVAPDPASCPPPEGRPAEVDSKPPAAIEAVGQAGAGAGEGPGSEVIASTFRFDDAIRGRLNAVLKRFCGTHNFHNYTARMRAEDPSCKRYILTFEAKEVVVLDGEEYVRCCVVGQSFVLHQIRKMIGMAIAVVRNAAPESLVEKALRQDTRVNVPMAPELGLFLEECFYPAYNKRFHDSHDSITMADFKSAVDHFKRDVIYPHIAGKEKKENVMRTWLLSLDEKHYPDFKTAWAEGGEGERGQGGGLGKWAEEGGLGGGDGGSMGRGEGGRFVETLGVRFPPLFLRD